MWLALAAAATAAAYGAIGDAPVVPGRFDVAPLLILQILFQSVAIEFAAGMGIAILYLRRGRTRAIRLPVDPLWVFALAFLAAMAFASLLLAGDVPRIVLVPVLALPLVPLVYLGVHAVCPPGVASSVGRVLGDASYAIYLFHPHAISVGLGILVAPRPAGVDVGGGRGALAAGDCRRRGAALSARAPAAARRAPVDRAARLVRGGRRTRPLTCIAGVRIGARVPGGVRFSGTHAPGAKR